MRSIRTWGLLRQRKLRSVHQLLLFNTVNRPTNASGKALPYLQLLTKAAGAKLSQKIRNNSISFEREIKSFYKRVDD